MANVLLTGAAGSVGYETLQRLIADGHRVTALDIKSSRNSYRLRKYQKQAHIVYGDIRDRELVSFLVKDQDIVLHLAAIIPPKADKSITLTESTDDGLVIVRNM